MPTRKPLPPSDISEDEKAFLALGQLAFSEWLSAADEDAFRDLGSKPLTKPPKSSRPRMAK